MKEKNGLKENRIKNRFLKGITHVLGKVFNRFTIMVTLILVQFIWFGLVILALGEYAEWITIAFKILAAIMALFVIYRDLNPAYKMGWIVMICLAPILGSVGYMLFGNKRPSAGLRNRLDPIEKKHRNDLKQVYHLGEISDGRMMNTIEYIDQWGPYPAWSDTSTEYFSSGEEGFEAMLKDLKEAKHYIFMEYFIIDTGVLWDSIFQILKEKAEEGVDVRLIYDGFGCIPRLPIGFNKTLEDAGIRYMAFNPLRPVASLIYNNRDHRKITVIDGYIGYSGGYNIADEYVNRVERFGHWKDAGIRLEGKGVWNFTVMFLNMWSAFEGEEDDYLHYRPHVHRNGEIFNSDGIVQPYSDSPLDDESLGENVYMELINQAHDYIYIFTPYLILDNEMLTSLELAAKRGVDVRIVMPGIPDKPLTYRLSRSYYLHLIKGGVRIYEYAPGFIHSKCMLTDDHRGVVGTINFDYRSLFLHFECAVMMVGCSALNGLKNDFNDTFMKSLVITEKDCRTSFFGKLLDGLLRALSPLF